MDLTAPSSLSLQSYEGWNRLDDGRRGSLPTFYVRRLILRVAFRSVVEEPCHGEVLREITGDDLVLRESREFAKETEVLQLRESIRQLTIETELNRAGGFNLRGLATAMGFDLGTEVSIESKLRDVQQNTSRIQSVQTEKTKVLYKIELEVNGADAGRRFAVAVYQRCEADVILVGTDELIVQYEKDHPLQWRKRRRKRPRRTPHEMTQPWHQGSNFTAWSVPYCTMSFWSLLPESTAIVREGYDRRVDEPLAVTVKPPSISAAQSVASTPASEIKSLYTLANQLPFKFVEAENDD